MKFVYVVAEMNEDGSINDVLDICTEIEEAIDFSEYKDAEYITNISVLRYTFDKAISTLTIGD